MCNLLRHLTPRTFPLITRERFSTGIQLTYHFIIFYHKLSYLIPARPQDGFVSLTKVYFFHLVTDQGKGICDAISNKERNNTCHKKYKCIQVNNCNKEIRYLISQFTLRSKIWN